jgi:hypothetical protein
MRHRKRLTTPQERAAVLVAEDALTDEQIAAQTHVHRATLDRWRKRADFAARVEEHRARWQAEIETEGIANRQNRVRVLQETYDRLEHVIAARAADERMTAPGARTGLLVRTVKPTKWGVVEAYTVDTGLLRELREHLRQVAQELGQWTDHSDLTSGDSPPDLASLVLLARSS